jgi:hypothetical protein
MDSETCIVPEWVEGVDVGLGFGGRDVTHGFAIMDGKDVKQATPKKSELPGPNPGRSFPGKVFAFRGTGKSNGIELKTKHYKFVSALNHRVPKYETTGAEGLKAKEAYDEFLCGLDLINQQEHIGENTPKKHIGDLLKWERQIRVRTNAHTSRLFDTNLRERQELLRTLLYCVYTRTCTGALLPLLGITGITDSHIHQYEDTYMQYGDTVAPTPLESVLQGGAAYRHTAGRMHVQHVAHQGGYTGLPHSPPPS